MLDLFASTNERTLGVTEIANALGLSKAVAFRILSSFRAKGFVDLDERTHRYSLGAKVLQLGLTQLERIDIRQMARPVLEELSRRTDETATLSVRAGEDARVYIDQANPPRDVKMVVQLGRPVALHAGASSKALLAFLGHEEQDAYLRSRRLDRLTRATITSERVLRRELNQIRERGYATSVRERLEDAASVAAPILGHDARPVAVMSLSGPAERFAPAAEQAAALLVAATTKLSRRLGYRD